MNKPKLHLNWIDVLRFFGIFAIYLGHLGEAAGKLYPFVFIYHVPLFFFVSGFLSSYKKKAALDFVKEKFIKLMLPYYFFSFISLVYFLILYNWNLTDALHIIKTSFYGIRNQLLSGSLWFFPCLFLMSIIHYVFLRLFGKEIFIFGISVGLFFFTQTMLPFNPALQPSWFMNLDSALYYYVFYAAGGLSFSLTSKAFFRTKLFNKLAWRITAAAAALMALKCYFEGGLWLASKLLNSFSFMMIYAAVINSIFALLMALVIIFVNIFMAKKMQNVNFMRALGKETLIFCGTENICKDIIFQIVTTFGLSIHLNTPIASMLFVLFCLSVSYFTIVRFFNTYCPALIGKWRDFGPSVVSVAPHTSGSCNAT